MPTEKKETRRRRTIAEQRQEHDERVARCDAAAEAARAARTAWEIEVRAKHEAALRELEGAGDAS